MDPGLLVGDPDPKGCKGVGGKYGNVCPPAASVVEAEVGKKRGWSMDPGNDGNGRSGEGLLPFSSLSGGLLVSLLSFLGSILSSLLLEESNLWGFDSSDP